MTPLTPVLDERPSPGRPGDGDDTDPHAARGTELFIGSDPVEVTEPPTPPDPPAPFPATDLDVSPIFVDRTGHRRRRARRLAWAVAALCVIYLALFGAGLAGRPVNPSVPSGVLIGGPSSTTSEDPAVVTTSTALPSLTEVGPSRTMTRAPATTRRTVTPSRRTTQAVAPPASVLSPTPSRQSSIWPSTTTSGSTTGSSPAPSISTGTTTETRSEESSSPADTDEPDTNQTETNQTETNTQSNTDQTDTDESETVPSARSSR